MNEHMRNYAIENGNRDVTSQFLPDNKQLDNNINITVIPHWFDGILSSK